MKLYAEKARRQGGDGAIGVRPCTGKASRPSGQDRKGAFLMTLGKSAPAANPRLGIFYYQCLDSRIFPVENPACGVHNLSLAGPQTRRFGRRNRDRTPLDYYRGTETILVVDDEESLRNVVVDLLTGLGYNILSAPGGHEALALADKYSGKIDLLLTDVVMDPVPGPVLAENLTRERPGMKVVFISGYANTALAPDGILKPGIVLVQKPFTMKILSAKLREVLGSPAPV
jgi:CheY-like chemotaxis protein